LPSQALRVGVQTTINTAIDSVVNGESFEDSLVDNALYNTVLMAGANASHEVGSLFAGDPRPEAIAKLFLASDLGVTSVRESSNT
jgi:hypothetical protein